MVDPYAPNHFFELANGMRLAATVRGPESAPAVLFLHGGGQTRHAWGGTAEALAAEGFRTYAMDHRGHGRSDWAPDGDYKGPRFAADLREVLAQFARPPVVVGASLGGMATMLAAGDEPQAPISGAVFVDVTPRLEAKGTSRIFAFMGQKRDGFDSLDEVADAIAAYLPHRKRPTDLDGLRKNLRETPDGKYVWHWDPQLLSSWSPDNYTAEEGRLAADHRLRCIGRIDAPMMLIRGKLSDVVSEESAREVLEVAPHMEYVDLAGAAHMVAGDKNDAFSAHVIDFVRRTFAARAA